MAAAAAVWLAVVSVGGGALAEDPYANVSPERKSFFENLRYPCKNQDTGEIMECSCCGLGDGKQLNDEQWQQRGAEWWIDPDGDGKFFQVPADRVLDDPPSIDGQSYAFHNYAGAFLCFVPPVPTF